MAKNTTFLLLYHEENYTYELIFEEGKKTRNFFREKKGIHFLFTIDFFDNKISSNQINFKSFQFPLEAVS